jgi:hypothetical protein
MARALKFHTVVKGKTLSLPDLGSFEGKRVEVTVVEDEESEEQRPEQAKGAPRPLGLLRGQFTVPDDFNEPLPAEIQSTSRGKGTASEVAARLPRLALDAR